MLGLSKADIIRIRYARSRPKKTMGRMPHHVYYKGAEIALARALISVIREWRDFFAHAISPAMQAAEQEARAVLPQIKKDDWKNDVDRMINDFDSQADGSFAKINAAAGSASETVAEKTAKELSQQFKSVLGIDPYLRRPWLTDIMNEAIANVHGLMKKLEKDVSNNIRTNIVDGFVKGERHEEISKKILSQSSLNPGVFKKAETRAALIARDQVSKLNGKMAMLNQNEVGIDKYVWRSTPDERRRASHKAMEGKLCRWDNAAVFFDKVSSAWVKRSAAGGVELHPGEDIQCRCWPEPYMDEYFAEIGKETRPEPYAFVQVKEGLKKQRKVIKTGGTRSKKIKAVKAGPKKIKKFERMSSLEYVDIPNKSVFADKMNELKIKNQAAHSIEKEAMSVIEERMRWYKQHFNFKFNEIRTVENKSGVREYASVESIGFGNIVLNLDLVRKKGAKSILNRDVLSGFHPKKCNTVKATIDHEFLHGLAKMNPVIYREGRAIFDRQSSDRIREQVSKYALKNRIEFMAEGWAAYCNNPNPLPLVREIGETVLKVLKGEII